MPLSCKYRISVSVKVISVKISDSGKNWGEVELISASAEAGMSDIS